MVLPPPSSSRLTALKNARNSLNRSKQQQQQQQQQQTGISEYLRKASPIPHQHQQKHPQQQHSTSSQPTRQRSPVLSESQNTTSTPIHSNKIMDGVIACLDVRTEDGDDVSQNFERALQSMGAKTRRTFSDSITHLIFKNGSPATLKKALSKNVFIMNLLWISRCKREGKRLAEKDFIIERPQGLVLAGKKRRKSMEPGKVRALVMDEHVQPSLSSSSDSSANDEQDRRKTIATSSWKARDFSSNERKDASTRKRIRPDFEDEDSLDGVAAEVKLNPPRLSLPISVESIANRHINNKKLRPDIIPVHAPSLEKKEQIKARFSIGSKSSSTTMDDDTSNNSNSPLLSNAVPRLSIASTSNISTPIRRKRRLTGNLAKPVITPSASSDISIESLRIIPENKTLPKTPTIVLTSCTGAVRKLCEEAIKKLGKFEIASEVTENTTHVLVGVQRRTKSVTLGLLRGCWMLKPDWLIQSATKNGYASEKDYELLDWYPRAELARKRISLLPSTTFIRVSSSKNGVEFIELLVKMAGGSIVKKNEQANIIISDTPIKSTDKVVVNDTWLFESIEQWRYLSTENYGLK